MSKQYKKVVSDRQKNRRVNAALKQLLNDNENEENVDRCQNKILHNSSLNELRYVNLDTSNLVNNELNDETSNNDIVNNAFIESFTENHEESNLCHSSTKSDFLLIELRKWAVNNRIPHNSLGSLLAILKVVHSELPRDPRTLLSTPHKTLYKQLHNGNYCHMGLTYNLQQFIKLNPGFQFTEFKISFNIDGLPLFRSSNFQLWPILGHLKNEDSNSSPFVIGLFAGTSKPNPLNLFLEDFVSELKDLLLNGMVWEEITIPVKVHTFICDSSARAFIKCYKAPGGYSACERCTETGTYTNNRVVLNGINSSKRTDESFRSQVDTDHHVGFSPLLDLSIDLVYTFSLDYMHSVNLGVMRKLLLTWVGGNLNVRLTARKVDAISEQLVRLRPYIPKEFNRKPRSLKDLSQWKATEFRNFLLYFGPLVLKSVIDQSIYEHFLLFHFAISILVSSHLIKNDFLNIAEECLKQFILHCKNIYGPQYLIYNVHILCHLVDDVKLYIYFGLDIYIWIYIYFNI